MHLITNNNLIRSNFGNNLIENFFTTQRGVINFTLTPTPSLRPIEFQPIEP